VGFRWIAEAMAGGGLSGFDPNFCAPRIKGEPDPVNLKAFARRIDEIKKSLMQRKKVLVGHNCFLDLVFFYRYFFGNLPEKVEEFQEAIHTLFPLIIDTKYMATQGVEGAKLRNLQLWQIAESMVDQAKPTIGMLTHDLICTPYLYLYLPRFNFIFNLVAARRVLLRSFRIVSLRRAINQTCFYSQEITAQVFFSYNFPTIAQA